MDDKNQEQHLYLSLSYSPCVMICTRPHVERGFFCIKMFWLDTINNTNYTMSDRFT